jgi:hypothetical protein
LITRLHAARICRRWLAVMLAGLYFAGQGFAKDKAPAAADQRIAQFEPIVEPYQQIFPAFEIASRTLVRLASKPDPAIYGDPDALIGASVVTRVANTAVRLVISAPDLLLNSDIEVVLPKAGRRYTLYPSLQWRPGALAQVQQTHTVPLRFALYAVTSTKVAASNTAPLAQREVAVTVRPTNEVLFGVKDQRSGKVLDFNWLFAAFVDSKSPAIGEILQQAKQSGVIEAFQGYRAHDDEEVYAQVFAIWQVLQSRGIRYSNLPPPKAAALVQSQFVRFVEQTWRSQKANCVDGSVLIASALERAELKPVLVVLPGHMLLGFALNSKGTRYAYLETTLLGELPKRVKSPAALTLKQSFAIFERALREGAAQVDAAGSAFEDPNDLTHQFIDIAAARKLGVMPIQTSNEN